MRRKQSTSTTRETAVDALSTEARLKYAELREQGMEIPDIAAALNLPEELLQKFSREMELKGLTSLRLFWEMEQNSPVFDLKDSWNVDKLRTDLETGAEELKKFWDEGELRALLEKASPASEALSGPGPCPRCGFDPAA